MEVSTKERLTGALIVVLAVVVVAPEVLLGRRAPDHSTPPAQNPEDGAPLQTFSVQLDASRADPVAVPDVPAAAAAEIAAVPPPVTEDNLPAVSMPVPEPAPAAAESGPQAAQPSRSGVSAKPAAAIAAGKWWVQVGSYSSHDNAQREAKKLGDAGYTSDVSRTRQSGKDLFRVRAGPVADRDAARALQARLVAAGYRNPTLVAP